METVIRAVCFGSERTSRPCSAFACGHGGALASPPDVATASPPSDVLPEVPHAGRGCRLRLACGHGSAACVPAGCGDGVPAVGRDNAVSLVEDECTLPLPLIVLK